MDSQESIFNKLKTYPVRKEEKISSKEDSNNTILIKNQVKDIIDDARLETLNGANPEAYVDSIHESLLRTPDTFFSDDSPKHYLSQFIDKMPHGIVNKRITGIGATTLEIKSERSSIIVVPTRQLAKSKADKYDSCLYVGSNYDNRGNSTSEQDIKRHLQSSREHFKKFIVVADSLGKLIKCLRNEGIDVYSKYVCLQTNVHRYVLSVLDFKHSKIVSYFSFFQSS